MNPLKAPFALLGLLGFLAVLPGWTWFVTNRTASMPPEVKALIGLALPAVALLYLVSWLQPRGGGA